MKKTSAIASLLCAAAMTAALGFTSLAENTDGKLQPVRFDGTVQSVEESRLVMNRFLDGGTEEIIVNVSEDTMILDAVNGFPQSLESLQDGERIRVYVGPAMTMSLPPMTNAKVVLTDIPEDFNVPFYETVSTLTKNLDGTYTVVTAAENTYQVDDATTLLPYLTRNMVYVDNLQPGVKFLVWTTGASLQTAEKIVIFQGENGGYAAGQDETENSVQPHGWSETSEGWFYYDRGEVKTGWLLDGGDWYYLNPETGRMETGFVMVDGKTYFLKEDGRMLTESRIFTPDETGALHETANIS